MIACCISNLKIAINAKIAVFVIFVDAIVYMLLYNLHDFTFNKQNRSLRKYYIVLNPRTNHFYFI